MTTEPKILELEKQLSILRKERTDVVERLSSILEEFGHHVFDPGKGEGPPLSLYPTVEAFNIHYDGLDDVWTTISWEEFTNSLSGHTTWDESFETVGKVREAIAAFEAFAGKTYDQWLLEQQTDNSNE